MGLIKNLQRLWGGSAFFRRSIDRITSELTALLGSDYAWQASVLKKLNSSVQSGDLVKAERQFSSGDIWGGAGSVSDVSLPSPLADERKCRLLVSLVVSFARAGITSAAATEMASIYKGWIGQGIFRRAG